MKSASMLTEILAAFNVVAMVILTILLIVMTIRATVGTAHEGKFLGDQFHSVYVPLRGTIAVALLAPIANGLCMLQIILLFCIGISINAANYCNNISLNFMEKNKGRIVFTAPAGLRENTIELARGTLKSLTVQQYYSLIQKKKFSNGYVSRGEVFSKSGNSSIPNFNDNNKGNKNTKKKQSKINNTQYVQYFHFHAPDGFDITQSGAGTISLVVRDQSSPLYKTRQKAIIDMMKAIEPVANAIAKNSSAEYEDVTVPIDAYQKAINDYVATVSQAMYKEPDSAKNQKELKNFVETAKQTGWVTLGSYYWTRARFAERAQDVSYNFPKYSAGKSMDIYKNGDVQLELVLNSVRTADEVLEKQRAMAEAAPSSKFGNLLHRMSYLIHGPGLGWVVKNMTEGEPVSNIAHVGHWIQNGCLVALGSYVAVATTASGINNTSEGLGAQVLGALSSGGIVNAIAESFWDIVSMMALPVMFGLIAFYFMGCSMSYYLPAVPFILWIMSVVGCIILYIEAIFAAPLWLIAM